MRLPIALTSIHKWVGVVIGIQVLLWVAGGLVMSAFPIELVRGETQTAPALPVPIRGDEFAVELQDAIAAHGPITSIFGVLSFFHLATHKGQNPCGITFACATLNQQIFAIADDCCFDIDDVVQ